MININVNDVIEKICDSELITKQINMLKTLEISTKILEINNIEYWLGYGTLIGCLRHGGFIPWDDDIDICILKSNLENLLSIKSNEILIKKLHEQLYRISHNGWEIDVFVLPENHEENIEMMMSEIFPLKISKFNGIKCFIPNNPTNFFKRKYGNLNPITHCLVWNHKINDMWSDGFEMKKFKIKFKDLDKKWKKYKI